MVNHIRNLQTMRNSDDNFHKNFSSKFTVNIVSNYKPRRYLNVPTCVTI